jgi:hypothetical protein
MPPKVQPNDEPQPARVFEDTRSDEAPGEDDHAHDHSEESAATTPTS